MNEGDTMLINGDVEIHLREIRQGRASLRIKAPKNVPIKTGLRKP